MIDQSNHRAKAREEDRVSPRALAVGFRLCTATPPSCHGRNDEGEVAAPVRSTGTADPGDPNHRSCLVSKLWPNSFRRIDGDLLPCQRIPMPIRIRFAPFRSPETAAATGDTAMTSSRTFNQPFTYLRGGISTGHPGPPLPARSGGKTTTFTPATTCSSAVGAALL